MNNEQKTGQDIMVFETNARYKKDVQKIGSLLKSEKRISRWTIDREDPGKILRVESQQLGPAEVISLLHGAGFNCQELPD